MTRSTTPSIRSFRSTFASIVDTFVGARNCAIAAETGRRPSDRSLSAVGIDRRSWDRIGRF